MGCEICGRNNCCKSFHDFEEQKSFDDMADIVKDRCRSIIRRKIEKVDSFYDSEDNLVVKIDDVIQAIDDADL